MKTMNKLISFVKNQKKCFNDVPDVELILQILVIFEEVESFCPEKLIRHGTHALFSEAYQRFGTWDEIINQCVALSNAHQLFESQLMSISEILLEILKIENSQGSLREKAIRTEHPFLHKCAIMVFGSWNQALVVSGIRERSH